MCMTMGHNERELQSCDLMFESPSLGGGHVREYGLGVTPNPYLATGWIYINNMGVIIYCMIENRGKGKQ